MLFPYTIKVSKSHFPLTNVLLIVVCVIVHILVCTRFLPESVVNMMVLHDWSLVGLIGHQFLHGDISHILFNMIFLWIFGSAVNGRVGNLTYLGLYLICGVMAGALHFLLKGVPLIGASGAISGVIALCLVLFPTSKVKCLLCFGLLGCLLSINTFWITLIWFGRDVYSAIWGARTMVAHWAHVGGFLAGGILGLVMLRAGLYKREEGDDPTLIYYLVKLGHRGELPASDQPETVSDPNLLSLDMKFSCPGWMRWSFALLVIFAMPLMVRINLLFSPLMMILAVAQVAPDIADWFGGMAGGILYNRREGERIPMYGIPEKLVTMGKYVEAEAEYEKIMEEFPDEVKPYIDLVNVAVKRLNNAELAEQFYKKGMNALKKDEAKIQLEDVYFRVKTLLHDTSSKPELIIGKAKETVVTTVDEPASVTAPVMARPIGLSRPTVIPKEKSWKFLQLPLVVVVVLIIAYNIEKQVKRRREAALSSMTSPGGQASQTSSSTPMDYANKFVSVNFKLKYLTKELQGPGVYITGTLSNRGSKLVQNIRAYAEIRESGPNGKLVSKRDLDLGYIEAGQTRQITRIVHDLQLKMDCPLVARVWIYKSTW